MGIGSGDREGREYCTHHCITWYHLARERGCRPRAGCWVCFAGTGKGTEIELREHNSLLKGVFCRNKGKDKERE